jgi:bifunctional non-homologous end joining protein LigD
VSSERVETEVDGVQLSLSNLNKVLYPKTGFTKGAMVDYYARIAPIMLGHVADRPLTLRRYPNGVEEKSFFEKHSPSHRPAWVRTVRVPPAHLGEQRRRSPSSSAPGASAPASAPADEVDYTIISDRPSLLWAANLATIEFHVPLWRVGDAHVLPGPADFMVFDLDPGPGTSMVHCCAVALWISARLEAEGSGPLLPKTSGSKGMQLYLGLPGEIGWEEVRERSLQLARAVETDHPELVVTNMRKELRQGRVLIDWSQNHPGKTTVAAYSLRARPEPTVSTPVTWEEVTSCQRSGNPDVLRFLPEEVLSRSERLGDLMAALVKPA